LKASATPRRAVLRQWLVASGSLSRRLAALGTRFEVQTLRQGTARITPREAAELGAQRRMRCWVREVVLRVDGVALVWARSVAPRRALNGPWRALRGLGSRPLAELLFNDPRVKRTPLRSERLARHGPLGLRLARQWRAATATPPAPTMCWGRSSVFRKHGAPLRVMEVFAPSIAAHPPSGSAR
jgi:chorismate--pyruvate lyase